MPGTVNNRTSLLNVFPPSSRIHDWCFTSSEPSTSREPMAMSNPASRRSFSFSTSPIGVGEQNTFAPRPEHTIANGVSLAPVRLIGEQADLGPVRTDLLYLAYCP